MLYLTKEEERMLNGEEGVGSQLAMELLVKLGKIFNAQRLVHCSSAHCLDFTCWHNELTESETHIRTNASNNPRMIINGKLWKKQCVPEKVKEKEDRISDLYKSLGMTLLFSCTPYLLGNAPRFGEHFSWGGSSGQVFANAILGARGNREGGAANLAAAITGRTIEYGLHLTENRKAQVVVDFEDFNFHDLSIADIGALGFYVGKQLVEKIPVFTNIEGPLTFAQVKALTYPLPVGGATQMYHIANITPEAKTLDDALQNDKPEDELTVNRKNIKETYGVLNTVSGGKIDLVIFGCPHCNYLELQEAADLLNGKKINPNTEMWILTSMQFKLVAERMGLIEKIEKSGAQVITDTCGLEPWKYRKDIQIVATNSSKIAFFGVGMTGRDLLYGSTKQCIDAAINGRWS